MISNYLNIAGIDYGSKLAGTTVIAFLNAQHEIEFAASQKNQDADHFILQWVAKHQPNHIFLDAPLSLPGVYQNKTTFNDYFYRMADKAVQAMSPLFLGGLTARAMKLSADLTEFQVITLEVYPAYLAKTLALDKHLYKKQREHMLPLFRQLQPALSSLISQPIQLHHDESILTWHHFDAILALLSGLRYLNHQHLSFGDPSEGLIIV